MIPCLIKDVPRPGGAAMKKIIGIGLLFWLICGLAAAWMLNEFDAYHWRTIAKGPIGLIQAFNSAAPYQP